MKALRKLFRRGSTDRELAFDPLDPAYVQDPYPTLRALREREPLHRNPRGLWVVTRYADVEQLLADNRLGNSPAPYAVLNERNCHRYVCADVARNILPFQDPPQHTLPRKLIGKTFLDHVRQQPPQIEAMARQLLVKKSGDELDLLQDFATPLSISVLARFLGVPAADEARLKQWSEWFFYLFSPIPSEDIRDRLDRNLVGFRQYFSDLLQQRRERPEQDLVSALMRAELDGEKLSEAQLIDTCMLLFADGVENVDELIASAIAALLQHPDQLQLLRQQPELLSSAVDECLRYESPAQFIGRVAEADIELYGQTIRKHEGLLLVLGSANRDPEKFQNPERLDIQRSPNPYLSFGKGRHACIGGSLVRLELEIALRVLLEELPTMKLAEEKLLWTARLGHRWLARLRINCTPSG